MERESIFFESEANEKKEVESIRKEIKNALNQVRISGLFDEEYIDNVTIITYGEKVTHKFNSGNIIEIPKKEYAVEDFIQGRRIDFVAINPKKDFENYDISKLSDKQLLPFIFLEKMPTYPEFVVHEMAHNIFDGEYIQKFGQFKDDNGASDVSEEYREKIRKELFPLLKKYYPIIEVSRFSLNRQQIAEIYSFLYQREFWQRVVRNSSIYDKLGRNIRKFMKQYV
jgi:hypothetical protein